ncbi:uncharacterized protein F4817DRAFT_363901 [Daldinia loculata]|uniref:uncharacterized protein n=1 Tax=Daldinia loculata TaxID=103429 RepID=UPI0020C40144|nr:uncharacterized protein F4817DRAFT_363901 [Daldinia loculata]KAI1649198.1 hypothetical protein F4817DRAFT_363901 [Daldinia loculata]
MSTQERRKVYKIEDDDELSSDAHSGEGEDYKAIEQLTLADAKKRKHGELLVASTWAGNIRRKLSEIEEIGLEELKAQKHKEIDKATKKADNIRWALIEVEDWGLAIREGLLPDGTPLKFSNYFITHLKGAVEKAEAAMALAKIAVRATLNISYLGLLSRTSFALLGVPFTNLTDTYESLTKELQNLEKRIKMWREIADNRGVPVGKGKGSAYNVEDDPMANPADPFFEADEEVREILKQELEQTINNATTIDGKRVDSKAILDRYFNYLNQYRDNFYAAVGTPEEKKTKKLLRSKEVAERLAERREKRFQAAKEERVKRKAQQELNEKRKARTEMRKDIIRKAELDRKDFEERKRKRAAGSGEDLRLGFYTPPVEDGEPDLKRLRVKSPPVSTPPTPETPEIHRRRPNPPMPVTPPMPETPVVHKRTPPPTPPMLKTPEKPTWGVRPVGPVRPTPLPTPEWVKSLLRRE